jgi:hypothetical protein
MRTRGSKLVLLLAALAPPSPAAAHDLPFDRTMNGFVKVEPSQLHLVVRVPLDLLRSVPFPVNGPQYDLAAAGPAMRQALGALAQALPIREGGVRLVPSSARGRLSLPSDRSFGDYDRAAAHVATPLEADARVYYEQGFLDADFTYPIASPRSAFSIGTNVAPDLADLVRLGVRYLPLGGGSRAFVITSSSGQVPLDPSWLEAARGFVALGVEHILTGIDHLLFLFCLIIPFRRVRALVPIVTAFTVAHSFALVGSAYGLAPTGAWFPPFVETAIAASIVYMALENVLGGSLRSRWLVTGLFGVVHGFGFSYGLQERLQLAGSHLLASLFAFNVGIEIGQLLVLAAAVPALALLRRAVPERAGTIVLSALVAHTGWHWMVDRWQALARVGLPRPDAASLLVLAKWTVGLTATAAVAWLVARWADRTAPPRADRAEGRSGGSPAA